MLAHVSLDCLRRGNLVSARRSRLLNEARIDRSDNQRPFGEGLWGAKTLTAPRMSLICGRNRLFGTPHQSHALDRLP